MPAFDWRGTLYAYFSQNEVGTCGIKLVQKG